MASFALVPIDAPDAAVAPPAPLVAASATEASPARRAGCARALAAPLCCRSVICWHTDRRRFEALSPPTTPRVAHEALAPPLSLGEEEEEGLVPPVIPRTTVIPGGL